ncbi:membrane protein C6F6.13c 1 [Stagonosporopsis vannaccii]|nr:membrane protein C6F6.13c 1 [Stagonosporopsis vannaccii]
MDWASKMPFGQSKNVEPHKDEQSLNTLLTADQCADLTFLIATITATMRQSLLDTFVAEELPLDTKAAKPEEQILPDAPSDLQSVDVSKEDKLKQERQKREQNAKEELSKPEVQQLKKEMLQYFDEWRGKVISRIGEVVNSREEATEQTKQVESQKIEGVTKMSEAETTSLKDLSQDDNNEDTAFKERYQAVDTQLACLDEAKRALILHSLVLLLLSLEHYSAHSRVLLLYIASSLHLNLSILKKDEETVAQGLLEAASQQLNADAETKKAAEASKTARKWKVGLASVAGAALIGVTGGLAAPLLAAGVGSVMGGLGLGATAAAGYLGTLAGSSVLVGGLFGAYGARMTGDAMDAYARQVEDFAFLNIHRSQDPSKQDNETRRLRVAIAVSGWLREPAEVIEPWRYIGKGTEGFALRWELEALLKLGHSLETFITSAAWGYAKKKIIEQTVFAAVSAAMWPLGLLKIATLLDNPFSVAKFRADKGGDVLADALINKVQGERPVTLVGYSLGARLIYSCLQRLADRKAFGLIENVVLLGAPCPSDAVDWRKMRSVVSGRVVNVFSTQDYILGFLYRTSSVQLGIAGLQPILGVRGVQNVDVTELVDGHLQYRFITGSILLKIGFEDVDVAEVKKAEREMARQKEKEDAERKKNEGEATGDDERDGEREKQKLEGEVQRKSEQSMWQVMQEKTKSLDIGGFFGSKDEAGKRLESTLVGEKKEMKKA